jgi:hypothetical protein
MESSQNYPLSGEVHMYKFEISTSQKNQQGRAHRSEKVRIVLAIEYRKGKAGKA